MSYDIVSDKKEIKSGVETALIRDYPLNLFSLDQIPQLRYNSNISNGVISSRVVESLLKKENRTLASTQTLGKFDQNVITSLKGGKKKKMEEEKGRRKGVKNRMYRDVGQEQERVLLLLR